MLTGVGHVKKIETFLAASRRTVPVFFYVAVPLLLRKSGPPYTWILPPVLILLLGYWLIRRKLYRESGSTGKNGGIPAGKRCGGGPIAASE